MRPVLVLLALAAVLAGCATPQQRCVSTITRDLATVQTLIAETERTIARGFTYRQEVSPVQLGIGFCTGYNSSVRFCGSNANAVRQVPVAVDIAVERQKLADLRAREATLSGALPNARAACAVRFPQQ